MKRTILAVFMAALPLALCVPVLQAEVPGPEPGVNKDASQMPESGPRVVGGTDATAGPNSKNQAITPMPGLRQDEELSERPPAGVLPVPEVRPVPAAPPAKR